MIFSDFVGALLISLVTGIFGIVWTAIEVRNLRRWHRLQEEGKDVRDFLFGSYAGLISAVGAIAIVIGYWV